MWLVIGYQLKRNGDKVVRITTDERSDETKKSIIFNGGRLNTVKLKRLLVEVVRHKCKMVASSHTSTHRKPTDRQRGTTAVTHVSPLLSASVLAFGISIGIDDCDVAAPIMS